MAKAKKGIGYLWSGDEPPTISPHSFAKHKILREYIKKYIEVVTKRAFGREKYALALVDGFAGGGEYKDEAGLFCPGSPLILLDAVTHAEVAINKIRDEKKLKIDAHFWFIDKDPDNLAHLQHVLSKRVELLLGRNPPTLIEGAFEEKLDELLADVKRKARNGRAIFVLDQYGYTDVRVPSLNKIFKALPHAEVFLTVAAGWLLAYTKNPHEIGQRLGIDGQLAEEHFKAILKHLRDAGDEGFLIDQPSRRAQLFAIQRLLHSIFTQSVNSTFYTPFFIVSRESNRAFWFLHMANHVTAHDVIKDLHWTVENSFQHFGDPGLDMLGYDPARDPELTGQYCFDFRAKELTYHALMLSLPGLIRREFPEGVAFVDLHQRICRETPATKELVQKVVSDLCLAGELEKRGTEHEQREPQTLPHDDDWVRVARQRSFPGFL